MNLRSLLSSLLLVCICSGAFAQVYTITGRVTDTLNANNLRHASATLLRAKDSVLETYTRTKDDGSFTLHPRKAGKYVIMVSFPSFVEFIDVLNVKDESPLDLGQVPMLSKAHLLQEVVLTRQIAAIKIKGDTTEYVADSFKVGTTASVEDLLKKLPGIQVDRNGQITAQGETVQKVLVDGEEFFSDDPAVVTKNLQANAVDKVQVFDKKSDQAEFTGIDDGTKTKTINLQLKEDKKKGYFGKAVAGGGTDQYWEDQAMFNAFKGKRKISAFGIMSNTGKIGLGWEDKNKFGSGGEVVMDNESGDVYTMYNSGDDDGLNTSWNGTYNGEGLPSTWTGGLHYSNKWNGDKQQVSGNYRYGKQNLETEGKTLTQYTIPGSSYYSDETKKSFSTAQRHGVDGRYEWKYDSLSTLKLSASGGYSETQSTTNYANKSVDSTGKRLNDGSRSIANNVSSKNFNATLEWRKKFAKAGRTLIATANGKMKSTEGLGFLRTNNNFYTNDTLVSSLVIDQRKENMSDVAQFTGGAVYTEPLLAKKIFLELNYGITLNNSSSEKLSYNKTSGDSYDSLNSINSSQYDFDVLTNRAGTKFKFVFKKVTIGVGGNVGFTRFNQLDKLRDTSFSRNYTNFFPAANVTYKLGKQSSFSLNYNGSTRQPTIDQIQPLQQNTDPLNVSIGNPELKQEFDHDINLRYNNYKVLTGQYTYFGGGFSLVNDDISRSETINSFGARTYQYINVDGNYNSWLYGGYGFKIKSIDLQLNINGNLGTNHQNSIINGVKNESNNNRYSIGISTNKYKEKKWSFEFNPNVSYNTNTNSAGSVTSTNYWSFQTEASGNVQLPKKFEIGTDINWNIRQRTVVFDRNNNVFRWNAYVSKKFMKKDQLELRASVFDILNQNIGYSRNGMANTIVENNYNTIRRYGMFSLIWNFTKSPVAPPQDGGGIIITN